MKLKEIRSLLIHTSYLRIVQFLWFRIKLFFIRRIGSGTPGNSSVSGHPFEWKEVPDRRTFIKGEEFTFLNLSVVFTDKPDWSYMAHGKLWAYQLESFGFLWQEQLEQERKEMLVADFAKFLHSHPVFFDPYPASLRIINWVKFFSAARISNNHFSVSLMSQAKRLYHSIEWHLQNNHLLENGFALIFAGQYFKNEQFYHKGKRIVEKELDKQVLPDGAHFELSPMYHQLMLHRVLDCIQLLQRNRPEEKIFLERLSAAASVMLGWMNEITFENGDMPMLNDSAEGMAPTVATLNSYANELKITGRQIELTASGYRKYKTDSYECLLDIGGLEPAVNPGHSHADSLSFILYVHDKPFIIDTGVSTYLKNDRRLFERSTSAHNTVCPEGENQSEMWGAFRVGKHSRIVGRIQGDDFFEVSVRFYTHKIIHTRRFEFYQNSIRINDSVSGDFLEEQKSFLYVEKKSELAHEISKLNSNLATVEFNGELGIKKRRLVHQGNLISQQCVTDSQFNSEIL